MKVFVLHFLASVGTCVHTFYEDSIHHRGFLSAWCGLCTMLGLDVGRD